jgi:hypothetical protein
MVGKLRSPFAPMEAVSVDQIPVGPEWQYEPKWDGFRCLSFRDGGTVTLQSKSCKPLTRYFPDVVDAVRSIKAESFVLDGEIVVPSGKVFSFDALLQRIHPAASRVHKLAEETPALMIVFDLLASPGGVLIDRPLPERRQLLEAFARNYFSKNGRIRLSPATAKIAEANKWLTRGGATLDGIIAKRCDKGRHGDAAGALLTNHIAPGTPHHRLQETNKALDNCGDTHGLHRHAARPHPRHRPLKGGQESSIGHRGITIITDVGERPRCHGKTT